MLLPFAATLSLAAFVSAVPQNAIRSAARHVPVPHAISHDIAAINYTGQTTFEQLIDHANPSLGTFSQRYWWSSEYWAGPGAPVVMFTPGEISADGYEGYLTNKTITGLFAQAIQGAVVMVEHRYWGESSPYDNLTTENMQYLTLENSIADLEYFANTAVLPFDPNGKSQAGNAPWILSGGSYSGALAAWTESAGNDTFWAYHASSAPVESIYDYWQYFYPVQQGMPQNCSTDVSKVVDYMDGVLRNGSAKEILELKTKFGLQAIEHNDDFMSVLMNGPWSWQENSFYTGYSEFYQFCDAVENVTAGQADTPGAEGVGLEVALAGYASWVNSTLLPDYCASYGYEDWNDTWSVGCFNTYNASSPLYTDISVGNAADRQWVWFLCNEPFAYWQDGAPPNVSTIASRLVTASYQQRQCSLYFPPEGNYTFASATGKTVHAVNSYTHGWEINNSTRLIWANGEYDPWRSSGMSSDFRPEGPFNGTFQEPLNVIPGGVHCADLIAKNGAANAGVQAVIDREIHQIKVWTEEYYTSILGNATMEWKGSKVAPRREM